MAPQAPVGDANVLPELWETIADVDRFMCGVFDDTFDTLTICSPQCAACVHDDDVVEMVDEEELLPTMAVLGVFTRDKPPREEELPDDPPLSALKKDQTMVRRRMDTTTEQAMFVPGGGLVGANFYHITVLFEDDDEEEESESESDDDKEDPRVYEERAILIQTVENYERLEQEPTLSKYFEIEDESSSSLLEDILKKNRFGEQVIVRGMDATEVAIGDIYKVAENLSPLQIEVSSPRLCCAYVDKRNGSVFGMAGVKRYCNTHGLGGIFARVLVPGELTDGMKLVRTHNPNPKWSMEYVSKTLYGEGPKKFLMKNEAHWSRSKEELEELCEIEAFGRYEWKDEAKYILKHWDWYHPQEKQVAGNTFEMWSANDLFRPFASAFQLNIMQSMQSYYTATMDQVDKFADYIIKV